MTKMMTIDFNNSSMPGLSLMSGLSLTRLKNWDAKNGSVFMGFTGGNFGLLDILLVCLEKIQNINNGMVFTWIASNIDDETIAKLKTIKQAGDFRWIFDSAAVRAVGQATSQAKGRGKTIKAIIDNFGYESVAFTNNHAKGFILQGDDMSLTCFASMNLNRNPRNEVFSIVNDKKTADFFMKEMGRFFDENINPKNIKEFIKIWNKIESENSPDNSSNFLEISDFDMDLKLNF